MEAKKNQAVEDVILRVTLDGSMQRGNIYCSDTTEAQRRTFRNALSKELNTTLKAILEKEVYNDVEHYNTIEAFALKITNNHKQLLDNSCLRIGTAQKLINLYWKFCWLINKVKTPIHCPYDRVILSKLKISDSWTKTATIGEYKNWVELTRKQLGDRNIAEWELEEYLKSISYNN